MLRIKIEKYNKNNKDEIQKKLTLEKKNKLWDNFFHHTQLIPM